MLFLTIIARSFKKTGISNSLDGMEDDLAHDSGDADVEANNEITISDTSLDADSK